MAETPSGIPARLVTALAGSYVVERKLRQGGMATVYLARDVRHERMVALKVLRPEVASLVGAERFLAEIKTTANLHHPHILPLHDSGAADGYVWYVMPYVEGESLADRLHREKQLPVAEAVSVATKVALALQHAHDRGVIHRDVKPANILLQDGEPVVADFGIALAIGGVPAARLTETGLNLGTPHYMSPEQATGEWTLDARTDVYGLGAVLYEMLAGEPPHTGPTAQAVLAKVLTGEPRSVTELRARVPPNVEEAITKAIEKLPADRFESAEAFGRALGDGSFRYATNTASRKAAEQAATSWSTRRWNSLRVAALGLVAIGVAFAGARWLAARKAEAPVLDPNLFAVMPWRLSVTDSSLAYLREGIVELLSAKLIGTQRAVEPSTLLASFDRAVGADADPSQDLALNIAEQMGAGRVLLGSVTGSPDQLTLSARLYEVPSGREVAIASVAGSDVNLAGLIDELTAQVISLGAGEPAERLEVLTSTSHEARLSYLAGVSLRRRGRYLEAAESFAQALRHDSTFALAALYLRQTAGVAGWAGTLPGGFTAEEIVRANRDRLPPRDRLFSLALLPPLESDQDRFARWIELVRQLPQRADVHYQLGEVLYHCGAVQDVPDFFVRARAEFLDAISLDPSAEGVREGRQHLSSIAIAQGDTAFAIELLTEMLRTDQTAARRLSSYRLAVLTSDTATIRQLDAEQELREEPFLTRPATGYPALEFELPRAERALERIRRRAITNEQRAAAHIVDYQFALNAGRPSAAERVLDDLSSVPLPNQAAAADRNRVFGAVYWDGDTIAATRAAERLIASGSQAAGDIYAIAIWRLSRGDTKGVQETSSRLRELATELVQNPNLRYIGDLRAAHLDTWLSDLQNGTRADSALRELDAVLRRPYNCENGGTIAALAEGNRTLARIVEERGDVTGALAVAKRVVNGNPNPYTSTYFRELGRLSAALGRRQEAIDAYSVYLKVRAAPEPRLQPEADKIRAEVRRLRSELSRVRDGPGG